MLKSMVKLNKLFTVSAGRKLLLAFTGLFLSIFLLVHMLGNLFILKSKEAYNNYANSLHEFFLFEILEWGLFFVFFLHIIMGLFLLYKNRQAKPGFFPKLKNRSPKQGSFLSQTLFLQACLLLGFLIHHLLTFKFGPKYVVESNGVLIRDIYLLAEEVFKQGFYVCFYTAAIAIVFIHLYRGLESLWRSLGISNIIWLKYLDRFNLVFSAVVFIGFILGPCFIYFSQR